MNALLPVVAAVAAYLIGSLSFAVIVSSLMGLNDPRTYGSGNPGATNVLRSGSKAAAALTLLLDAVKGLVPVLLVRLLGPDHGLHEGTLALVAIAAFLGHLFPVFFKFKGGKGVATYLGTLVALAWPVGLLCCATWAVTAAITRISSASALVAAASGAIWAWAIGQPSLVVLALALALLVWQRHTANISRLLAGTEPRIGKK